jgi:WD40 repeat protein
VDALRKLMLVLVLTVTNGRLPAADELKELKPTASLAHATRVLAVAISPDGKSLASASGDVQEKGELKLWDLATRKGTAVLLGHTQGCPALAFTPNGKVLVSGSWDKTIRLWDVATGKQMAVLRGHTGHVYCVAISPDGTLLASTGTDRTVRLWDMATRKTKWVLRGHTGSVQCVAFSPDGSTVASAGLDRAVRWWDEKTGRYLIGVRMGKRPIRPVAAPPTNEARLWDAKTGRALGSWSGHTGPVYRVVFTPDGKSLLASGDRVVRIWDRATRKERPALKGHTRPISSLAISPDGRTLASVSILLSDQIGDMNQIGMGKKSEVRLWDLTTGKELAAFIYPGELGKLEFTPDGKTLVSLSEFELAVELWDLSKVRDRKPGK